MALGDSDWEAERTSNRVRMRTLPSMPERSRGYDVIVVCTLVTVLGGIVFLTGMRAGFVDVTTPIYVLAGAILVIAGGYNALREVIDVPASIGASSLGLVACLVLIASAVAGDVGGSRVLAIGILLAVLTAYTAFRARSKRIDRPNRGRRSHPD